MTRVARRCNSSVGALVIWRRVAGAACAIATDLGPPVVSRRFHHGLPSCRRPCLPGQAHDTGRSSFARNTRYASVMEPDPTEPSRQDHDSGPDRPELEPELEPEPFDGEGSDQGPGRLVAHDPYTVLRDPNFRSLMHAGMVATVGNQMQGIAIGWELYERTSSPLALGMVGLAQVLPVILLAIPAGHAADRHSRKRLIILAHGLLLLATVGLALLSAWRGPVGLTYLFLVVTGVGQALNRPARWAILPQVVPRELLLSAVTWNTSAWQVAAMAGPALGGLVIALAGSATTCYVLNAGCSAVVIGLTASLRPRAAPRDSQPVSLRSLLAGLRFVFRTDLILATITLDLLAVFLGGATALLPILCPRHPQDRPVRSGLAARCPVDRLVSDGTGACPPTSDAAGRQFAPVGRGRVRNRDNRLRSIQKPLPLVCHALADRCARQHQRGRSPDARSVAHSGRYAGPSLRVQRHLHRLVQRARRVRVGPGRTAVRNGRLGGRRRHWHSTRCALRGRGLAQCFQPGFAARRGH